MLCDDPVAKLTTSPEALTVGIPRILTITSQLRTPAVKLSLATSWTLAVPSVSVPCWIAGSTGRLPAVPGHSAPFGENTKLPSGKVLSTGDPWTATVTVTRLKVINHLCYAAAMKNTPGPRYPDIRIAVSETDTNVTAVVRRVLDAMSIRLGLTTETIAEMLELENGVQYAESADQAFEVIRSWVTIYYHQTNVPEFTCPACGKSSIHPADIRNSYCPHCRTFPEDRIP